MRLRETYAYTLLLPDTNKLVFCPMRSTALKYARKWNDLTAAYQEEMQKHLPEGMAALQYHQIYNLDSFADGEGRRTWMSPLITFVDYVNEDQYNLVQSRLEESKGIGFMAIQDANEVDPKQAEQLPAPF